jgi:hypothetical protein
MNMMYSSLLPPPGDAFWIDSRLEIRQLIGELIRRRRRLQCWTGHSDPVEVVVLERLDTDEMLLRADPASGLDASARAGESLLLSAALGIAHVSFLIDRLEPASFGGEPAWRAHLPAKLHKLQRRQGFRVTGKSLRDFELRLFRPGARGRGQLAVHLADLSLGGLRLIWSEPGAIPLAQGDRLQACSLELPGFGTLHFDLEIMRLPDAGAGAEAGDRLVGARFLHLSDERLLQRFLYALQAEAPE